jgi:hypothetical protein
MLRTHLAFSLVALPFFFAAAPAPLPVPACPNTIVHEPIVLYDISGGTLAGPIDIGMTVYNDGLVRVSSSGFFGQPAQAETAFVGAVVAEQLLLDLSALGAGHLCDNYSQVQDLPVSTLTIFRNATDARNHTSSWLRADGAYGPIQDRLQNFLHTTFPNF